MEIKKFRAKTIQEAIQEVRRQLGPDAAILQTKEVQGGMLSWLRGNQIEVTATRNLTVASRVGQDGNQSRQAASRGPLSEVSFDAYDNGHAVNSVPSENRIQQPNPKPSFESRRLDRVTSKLPLEPNYAESPSTRGGAIGNDSHSGKNLEQRTPDPHDSRRVESTAAHKPDLHSQLSQLARVVDQLVRHQSPVDTRPRKLAGALFEVFTELLDSDIQPEFARQLVDQAEQSCSPEHLGDPLIIKARMANWVQQQMNTSGPIKLTEGEQSVVALVGPTGVGKTTTLAKLAAGFHLSGQCRVGLITIDTFRMGAIDQIRQYADIMALQVEVVESPDQMPAALERLSDCQLVLLDTTGRSPRDSAQLDYLSSMLRVAGPSEVHLVASASSSPSSLRTTMEHFSIVSPSRLILTKLDEVVSMGGLLPVLQSSPLPISYITTGQNVPHDIQEASRRRLASILLGQTLIP